MLSACLAVWLSVYPPVLFDCLSSLVLVFFSALLFIRFVIYFQYTQLQTYLNKMHNCLSTVRLQHCMDKFASDIIAPGLPVLNKTRKKEQLIFKTCLKQLYNSSGIVCPTPVTESSSPVHQDLHLWRSATSAGCTCFLILLDEEWYLIP